VETLLRRLYRPALTDRAPNPAHVKGNERGHRTAVPPSSFVPSVPDKEKGFNHRCTRMHTDANRLNQLSDAVLGCAFTVLNTLGAGFLEKVYENALAHELRKNGLGVAQRSITITYDGTAVGEYFADLLVEDTLLIELKATKALDEVYAQCINYLKATGLQLCLLLNFGKPRLEIKRIAN
jgi:GxxExxY protein